jgi:hypothetical protein
MSTAPYSSNASSKRDSWSSQLTTLHLVATAFLRWKTGTGQSRVTSGRESKMTHPPSLVMADTTACAPGTSKSPITTLALNNNIIHGWRQVLYWYDLPVLRESQGHFLADTVRAPCVVLFQRHVYAAEPVYHVPVRTTTLPLARSAYMNNSSSGTIVVMALVEGEEQSQGARGEN